MTKRFNSKKRKCYKDPLSNSKQKFEKIKTKINKAPINPDVQEIPRTFTAIQAASRHIKREKNKARELRRKRKRTLQKKGISGNHNKSKQNQLIKTDKSNIEENLIDTADFLDKDIGWYPKNGKPFKPIPTLKQLPGEPFYFFKKRVSAVTDAVIHEAKYREKFNVDVVRNESGEVVQVVKKRTEEARQKRRLKEKERKLKLKLKKNKSKGNSNKSDDPNLQSDDFQEKNIFRKENFAFGEVVHQPPSLITDKLDKMLKSKKEERTSLFLQKLRSDTASNHHAKRSQDRKDDINLESERIAAIQAYRQLKLKKISNVNLGMVK